MLAELTIRNFILIDDLTLSFEPHLNIVTGETGAGKSIIIESINLLVGGRADLSRIKRGADSAEITGLFLLDDGREYVLKRLVGRSGKGRAFINGQPVTTNQLSDIGGTFLGLHGQHEHQALLKPQNHLELIDRFDGRSVDVAKKEYRRLLADYRTDRDKLHALTAVEANKKDRLELLDWQIRELNGADLKVGEDDRINEQINRLKSGAKLAEAVLRARKYLDEGGGLDNVQLAHRELERASQTDGSLKETASTLGAAAAELGEAVRFLSNYSDDLEFTEDSLESLQSRFFQLFDLKKKYGLSIDGLIDYLASARDERAGLVGAGQALDRLSESVAELKADLTAAAVRLSELRCIAADKLSKRIRKQLQELAMANADFTIHMTRRELDEGRFDDDGLDKAEFFFSANAGEPTRPLARTASGGELARVMLAILTVIGRADAMPCLVFDEIDAGIGGKTAVKVGECLASLAGRRQVICVTHLASIAAFADHHLAVRKTQVKDRTVLAIERVRGKDRLAELSRLSGALNESTVSVEHARQLLDQAAEKKSAVGADV